MNKQIVKQQSSGHAATARTIADVVPPQHSAGHQAQPAVLAQSKTIPVRQAGAAQARKPQQAQTLMRHAVKKPGPGIKKQMHTKHEIAHTPSQAIAPRQKSAVDAARLQRATKVAKNDAVNRFYAPAHIPTTYAHTPVQTHPTAPQAVAATQNAPATPPPVATEQFAHLFEQAIASATHYVDIAGEKAHFKKRARRHVAVMSTGVIAVLVFAGFAVYLNTPRLQARVASAVAGVSTQVPNFAATGFTYRGVSTADGALVYTLEKNGVAYRLTQQATSWTGEQMVDHVATFDANGVANYSVTRVDDTDVYSFGSSHASWVKDGTWHKIQGDKALSTEELSALVRSS